MPQREREKEREREKCTHQQRKAYRCLKYHTLPLFNKINCVCFYNSFAKPSWCHCTKSSSRSDVNRDPSAGICNTAVQQNSEFVRQWANKLSIQVFKLTHKINFLKVTITYEIQCCKQKRQIESSHSLQANATGCFELIS